MNVKSFIFHTSAIRHLKRLKCEPQYLINTESQPGTPGAGRPVRRYIIPIQAIRSECRLGRLTKSKTTRGSSLAACEVNPGTRQTLLEFHRVLGTRGDSFASLSQSRTFEEYPLPPAGWRSGLLPSAADKRLRTKLLSLV